MTFHVNNQNSKINEFVSLIKRNCHNGKGSVIYTNGEMVIIPHETHKDITVDVRNDCLMIYHHNILTGVVDINCINAVTDLIF